MQKKLKKPEKGFKYSFMLKNGNWHHFAFYGETPTGRLQFINTTYGNVTEMSAARFSYMMTMLPKKIEPYILEEHFPTTAEERRKQEAERLAALQREKEIREREENKKFQKIIFKLKTLPIDVEYTINKELKIDIREFASGLNHKFALSEAETLGKISHLLEKTPYALPNL